jgi:hypothetical protein
MTSSRDARVPYIVTPRAVRAAPDAGYDAWAALARDVMERAAGAFPAGVDREARLGLIGRALVDAGFVAPAFLDGQAAVWSVPGTGGVEITYPWEVYTAIHG